MNVSKKKITIVGPFPDPITGNSFANQMAYEGLARRDFFKMKSINTSLPFFDEEVGVFSIRKFPRKWCG